MLVKLLNRGPCDQHSFDYRAPNVVSPLWKPVTSNCMELVGGAPCVAIAAASRRQPSAGDALAELRATHVVNTARMGEAMSNCGVWPARRFNVSA